MSSPLSEEGSEALTEVEDSSEHSVSDSPSKLVSSSDKSCSSLSQDACLSLTVKAARCINTLTVVFVFVFEYSKGRRPCFYSSTSSKTHETYPSKDAL